MAACLCEPIIWSMAAMLCDSVAVIARHMRPRAMPLAMITMRKSAHGFPLLSYMSMGLHLAALQVAGAPLSSKTLLMEDYVQHLVIVEVVAKSFKLGWIFKFLSIGVLSRNGYSKSQWISGIWNFVCLWAMKPLVFLFLSLFYRQWYFLWLLWLCTDSFISHRFYLYFAFLLVLLFKGKEIVYGFDLLIFFPVFW